MAIKLYDLTGAEDDRRFSPYCWRTKMALKHKGLEFDTVPWRFTDKEAIAFTEQGLVPVIKDGSHVVHDSWLIALYLDEAYPQRPGLFHGTESRALTEFFANWAFRALHPAVLKVVPSAAIDHANAAACMCQASSSTGLGSVSSPADSTRVRLPEMPVELPVAASTRPTV